MFSGCWRRNMLKPAAIGREMIQFAASVIFTAGGPEGVIGDFVSQSTDRQQVILSLGNEIRNLSFHSKPDDFLVKEAAQIKNLGFLVEGQPFWNQVFLRDRKGDLCPIDDRILLFRLHNKRAKTCIAIQRAKNRIAVWVKTLVGCDALFQ